ncbi:DsbA family protein [Polycladidibacter stylochi]|uniref:DsbA family protein n=1 Tax=Polycladidibacter stylochi TaxID=1807766 RepID=UPI000AD71BDC|nr:thioredoxin domain-containing protein [Pseudovibrio stylochi]
MFNWSNFLTILAKKIPLPIAIFFLALSLANAQTVSQQELLKAGSLPEAQQGSANAPITIIEYSSLTCGHCAFFSREVFPLIEENYIKTGKVNYITREFPLDAVASAAYMIGRALPPEQYRDYIEMMFAHQREWAYTHNPYNALLTMGQQVGMNKTQVEAAITNQEILDGLQQVRDRAYEQFEVSATPTFFINGKKYVGALKADQIVKIIEAELKK